MKKKTLVFILTLVLAAVAVCLVACNKNNDNDDSNKGGPNASGTPETYTVTKVEPGYRYAWGSHDTTGYQGETLNDLQLTKTTATEGMDYSFNEPYQEGYEFEINVTIGGQPYDIAAPDGGVYTIPGKDITGNIEITCIRHIEGLAEALAGKDSYTYTDGDGIYNADGTPASSNGNSVTYEGVFDRDVGAYFRVTAVVDEADLIGNQAHSDNMQVWVRTRTGTMLAGEYLGINGASYGSLSLPRGATYLYRDGDKTVEVFEYFVSETSLSQVYSGNELYATLIYQKTKDTPSTCVFAGKGSEGGDDYSKYWSVNDGRFDDKGVDGFGNATLVTKNGIYDMFTQAKTSDGITIDGVLDDAVWGSKTSKTYNFTGGESVTYAGFTGANGIYFGVKAKSRSLEGLDDTQTALRLLFPDDKNSAGLYLRAIGLCWQQRVMGAEAVKITKDSDNTYTIVFEGYIPYRVLQAKRSNYADFVTTDSEGRVTSVDVNLYFTAPSMKVTANGGTESAIWLENGSASSIYNFTLSAEGLSDYCVPGYDVTATDSVANIFTVTAADIAEYGKNYSFTVNKLVENVVVEVSIAGKAYAMGEPTSEGVYTIPGADVTGNIAITVREPIKVTATQTVAEVFEVTAPATAAYKKDYSFSVNKLVDNITMSVTIGGKEYTLDAPVNNTYKISGENVTDVIVINVFEPIKVGKPANVNFTLTGDDTVSRNGVYEFTVSASAGYVVTEVKIGEQTLTGTDGKYSYRAGTENFTISVTVETIQQAHEATFSIAFNANNGTGSTEATGIPLTKTNVEWGSTINLNSAISREGYIFLGWATSADADTPAYGASALENVTAYFYMNGDISDPVETGETVTLYAVWQAEEYALNVVQNGYADLGTHTSNTNGAASTPDYITVSATKAVFDTDLTFTDPSTLSGYSDYEFEIVVTIDGIKYNLSAVQDGKYTIPGEEIVGVVSITVTRHIKGYEILEDKASVTYIDGDGVYGANGQPVESNGNSVKYEGVYDPSKGAYFRVTVVTKSIDNEGTATTSDQINVWMLKNGGTAASDAVRLRFGLSGSTINQNQIIDFTKVVYASPRNNDGTYTSVFELFFPASALTNYVSGNDLYLMIAYTPSDDNKARETCVFAGKPQREDFARYWSLCGTEANTVGWRNGILVNANGFYDFNGQAKLNGVTLDGKLDESAWSGKTSVAYSATDMGMTGNEEITYTGFMGEDGLYYAATLKISEYAVNAKDGSYVLVLNFSDTDAWANPRIELQISGLGNVNRVMGGIGVCVTEADGYYTVTFEGYVPYRVMNAKWPNFTFTAESLSLYMGFQTDAKTKWLKEGEFSGYRYNFTFTKSGLALKVS